MPQTFDEAMRLGREKQQNGDLQLAERAFSEALRLRPDDSLALYALANLALQANQPAVAIQFISPAIARCPQEAVFQFCLGSARRAMNQFDAARDAFQKIISSSDDYNLVGLAGRSLSGVGCFDEAVDAFEKAIHLNPQRPEAYVDLGDLLRHREALPAAAEAYRKALHLDPGLTSVQNSLAWVLLLSDKADEAERHIRTALAAKPDDPLLLNTLGAALSAQNKIAGATEAFESSAAFAPKNVATQASVRWNLSKMLLLQGDFDRGWREFESRLDHRGLNLRRAFTKPQWAGEDLAGKTILLHAEGGHGDAIHFIRYVPHVKARGGNILLECHPALTRLFRGISEISETFSRGEPLPPFDCHIPLQSLPLVFKTTLTSIPGKIPYLSLPAADAARLQEKSSGDRNLKVGIAWCGSDQPYDKRTRSLAAFAPLADVAQAVFYSLQTGPAASEAPPLGMRLNMLPITDFYDMAASMDTLDLVISVDSAPAHLAGALAKPVWTMIPFHPDFRWLIDRDDSPWYPTMRLFRQRSVARWDDVFDRVRTELQIQAASRVTL